jgi:uncharacterized protein (TIGR03437 family)
MGLTKRECSFASAAWSVAVAICVLATGVELRAQPGISIYPGGIVNAASYAPGAPLSPGSIATAFGSFPATASTSSMSLPLPMSLAGVSLEFANGQMAPLFFVSSSQVNFQVPWELSGESQTQVMALANGDASAPQTMTLAPFSPGIFSLNGQGTGQGAILDSLYNLANSANPAIAGSTVVLIYATGLGAVTNQPASGSPAPANPLAYTTTTPVVTIGGATATVQFSGLAPGLVGVYQVNALTPATSTNGNAVPVSISIGGVTSNTVTMAVTGGSSPNPTPAIAALSPFSASPGTGPLQLTITGSGFVPSSSVVFNGQPLPASFVNNGQLTATLSTPQLGASGSLPVVVSNPSPGGGSSNAANFIVQSGFNTGLEGSVAWAGYARDDRHTALSLNQSQPLNQIHWSTPVDLAPQYTGGELYIHYGSPLVTAGNTVIVPVKTGASGGFRVDAHSGANGELQWSLTSDYVLPPHNWIPEFDPIMTPASRIYFPGAGGTVYYRDAPDSATGAQGQIAFYGLSNYQADPQPYAASVMINTPITSDSQGNIYFGFVVTEATPVPLQSGMARISASGQGIWISAAEASGDATITEVAQNCAPAINESNGTLYIAVSDNGAYGYLLALNSVTLQPVAKVRLIDPALKADARIPDDGSASPTIGPDGDVYYGVLDDGENHDRGWLLHFDSLLSQSKIPGAFGWDDTASVVPSFMVPTYSGASSYLLMTKYNDYYEAGGTGLNRLAIVDPGATETDPVTGETVMKEILTILGPTSASPEPGVKEWCINSAAVDPSTDSVLAGSEDGKLYRWDLRTNTFSQSAVLTPGIGEAYTPTLIGPDGTVYAINNATLFAVGQ